jgi:uncharacterized protein YjiS (DUF1127 family)
MKSNITLWSSPEMTTTVFGNARDASASWLDRGWALVSERLGSMGRNRRLRALNDHMLRDIGENRADLEDEALFWPVRRSAPKQDC